MPGADTTEEEIEQAVAAYTRDMRAYTARLYEEVKKKVDEQKGSEAGAKKAVQKRKGESSERGRKG